MSVRALSVALVMIGICAAAGILWAADVPDFSGSWMLKSSKGEDGAGKTENLALKILQTPGEITITTITDGHPSNETVALGASGTACRDTDGGSATCSAQWKGKTLVLETVYTAHPTESGPDVEMHTRERLELSSDRKTLTIKTDTKAPEYPALEVSGGTTEVYARE
jgi:hypothetical protein